MLDLPHQGFVRRVRDVGLAARAPAPPASVSHTTGAARATKAAARPTTAAKPAAAASGATTGTTGKGKASAKPAASRSTGAKAPAASTASVATTAATTAATALPVTVSSVTSASLTSASALAAGDATKSATSSLSTGTLVGIIAGAVVLLLAVIIGIVWWKKSKNRAARAGSNSALIGGAAAAGFKKQKHDDDDEMFGNSARPLNSGFLSEKHEGSAGPYSNNYGATQQVAQPKPGSPGRPSWEAPSYSSNAYPPPTPASTQQLLDSKAQPISPFDDNAHMQQQQARAMQPAPQQQGGYIDYVAPAGAAGAAGAIAAAATATSAQASLSMGGPFADSPGQGKTYIVRNTFEPSQSDELVIYPGDHVQVLMTYDDGWALGINLDSGSPPNKGVFPFDCVGEMQPHEQPQPSATVPEAQQPAQYRATNEPAPQLAPLRSDSPLGASFPSHPAIQVQSEGSLPQTVLALPGESANANKAANLKRTSSLIASRDANLFVALGEALGDRDGQQGKTA